MHAFMYGWMDVCVPKYLHILLIRFDGRLHEAHLQGEAVEGGLIILDHLVRLGRTTLIHTQRGRACPYG